MDNLASLVESTIDGVKIDTLNKKVIIDIAYATSEQGRVRIIATDVDDFAMSEMRLSNVIDRVTIFDSGNFSGRDLDLSRRLFFLIRGRDPIQSELEWDVLKRKTDCVRDGELTFMEIEPVYGASIKILAKSFKLE